MAEHEEMTAHIDRAPSYRLHSEADIYRTAALLRRLPVPADLIPHILDLADFTYRITAAKRSDVQCIGQHTSRFIYLTAPLPHYVAPLSLRRICFTTSSRDQGWSWDRDNHGTYNGSWTWFEAATLDVDSSIRPGQSLPPDISAKEIIRNFHASWFDATHQVLWSAIDDDEYVQQAFRDVRSRKPIALVACAQYPAWINNVASASIDFDVQPVRKM